MQQETTYTTYYENQVTVLFESGEGNRAGILYVAVGVRSNELEEELQGELVHARSLLVFEKEGTEPVPVSYDHEVAIETRTSEGVTAALVQARDGNVPFLTDYRFEGQEEADDFNNSLLDANTTLFEYVLQEADDIVAALESGVPLSDVTPSDEDLADASAEAESVESDE